MQIIIPGEAVPWGRARLKGGMHFTPAKQRAYMDLIRHCAAECMMGRPPLDGPIELQITATYLRPKSAPKRRPPVWKATKPDADNLSKIVSDALNKVAFRDDAQVALLTVGKRYGDTAGLVITLKALE